VLVAFVFVGCLSASKTESKPKPLMPVMVGTPVVMQIVEWDEFVGRFAPIESVQVRARVSGYLATTDFIEGQFVKAGDIIAVIDQRPFLSEVAKSNADLTSAEAQLSQARASVDQTEAESQRAVVQQNLAKKQLDRNILLVKENATSQQDFEIVEAQFEQSEAEIIVATSRVDSAKATVKAAEAAVKIAQASLDLAKLNLQYTEVRAPINGRISSRLVTEGNLVSGGTNDATLLTTIISMDPIHCYFDADEQTYLKYLQMSREGKRKSSREVRNPVYLALANEHDGFPHEGQMDFVETRLDDETGTIRGRAILSNADLEFTPGLFARVRLPGGPPHEAILVPDKAIGTDQAEKFVLTVDNEDKIVRKLVTLGPISHGLRIVRSGLTGTERVVLAGQQRARPGNQVAVTVEEVKPSKEALPDDYEPVPPEKWLTPKRLPASNVKIEPPKESPVESAQVPVSQRADTQE